MIMTMIMRWCHEDEHAGEHEGDQAWVDQAQVLGEQAQEAEERLAAEIRKREEELLLSTLQGQISALRANIDGLAAEQATQRQAKRALLDKMEAAINKGALCVRACVHVR